MAFGECAAHSGQRQVGRYRKPWLCQAAALVT